MSCGCAASGPSRRFEAIPLPTSRWRWQAAACKRSQALRVCEFIIYRRYSHSNCSVAAPCPQEAFLRSTHSTCHAAANSACVCVWVGGGGTPFVRQRQGQPVVGVLNNFFQVAACRCPPLPWTIVQKMVQIFSKQKLNSAPTSKATGGPARSGASLTSHCTALFPIVLPVETTSSCMCMSGMQEDGAPGDIRRSSSPPGSCGLAQSDSGSESQRSKNQLSDSGMWRRTRCRAARSSC